MSKSGILDDGLEKLGITLDQATKDKLLHYLAMLEKWNKVFNLTAIRDPKRMVSSHLLDSLAVLPHLWSGRWLDVGCGAGLPGVIMAIVRPDWGVDLLDSNSKKTSFVQQAIIELQLANANVYCARVEGWRPRAGYDGIVSRAFSDLGLFMQLTRHLIAENGRWAAMKGAPEHELAGVPDGCEVERVVTLEVPGLNAARSLVIASCKGSKAT